jgi:hypothetical protein
MNPNQNLPGDNFEISPFYHGLVNQGATGYLNSVFQQLFWMPNFLSSFLTMDASAKPEIEAIQIILASLLYSPSDEAINPKMLFEYLRDQQGQKINIHRENDAYVFLSDIFDQLGKWNPQLKNPFLLSYELIISNLHSNQIIEEPETYTQLGFSLRVKGHSTLEECLDFFMGPYIFQGENQYCPKWFIS